MAVMKIQGKIVYQSMYLYVSLLKENLFMNNKRGLRAMLPVSQDGIFEVQNFNSVLFTDCVMINHRVPSQSALILNN